MLSPVLPINPKLGEQVIRLVRGVGYRFALPALIGLWAVLTIAALWARPLAPVDETRYASVAWEMWLRGDWLLPRLNGAPYSDKAPLLFWLVNLAWKVSGPIEWAPRFVCAAATLLDLFLLHRLERLLWPEQRSGASLSPWLFYGCFFVASFSTLLMFDLLVTTAVLAGLIGLVRAWRRGGLGNWALYGFAIGAGALAKGPVILLYLLPVALLAPWWTMAQRAGGWLRWYRNVALALLAGAALALCWAIPAARSGGPDYADMLLWGQASGRLTHALQHARAWWWYLPLLPAILLPWSLWPPLWQALAALRREAGAAERFCAAWFLSGLLIFSAISGKQLHYLIPLLPALALLGSRAVGRMHSQAPGRLAVVLVLAPWVCLGAAMAVAPMLAARHALPAWWAQASPLWGVPLVALALACAPALRSRLAYYFLAALAVLFAALLHAGPVHDLAYPRYDARPLARRIATLQAEGVTVAYPGKYHGDFQFAGRLRLPLVQFWPGTEVAWAKAHPQAVLVLTHRELNDEQRAAAILALPYRGREVALWRGATLAAHPEHAAGAVTASDGPLGD